MKALSKAIFILLLFSILTANNNATAGDRSLEINIQIGGDYHYEKRYERIIVEEYYRLIDVDIRTRQNSFTFGDPVEFDVRVDEDSYIYLFLKNPYGDLTQLFPNYQDRNNFLERHRWYRFPDHHYDFVAEGFEGNHEIVAIASTERISTLEARLAASSRHDPWPSCPIGYNEIRSSFFNHYEVCVDEHIRLGRYHRAPDCIRIENRYLPGFGERSKRIEFCRPVVRYHHSYRPTYSYSFSIGSDYHHRRRTHYSSRVTYNYQKNYNSHKKDDHRSNHHKTDNRNHNINRHYSQDYLNNGNNQSNNSYNHNNNNNRNNNNHSHQKPSNSYNNNQKSNNNSNFSNNNSNSNSIQNNGSPGISTPYSPPD